MTLRINAGGGHKTRAGVDRRISTFRHRPKQGSRNKVSSEYIPEKEEDLVLRQNQKSQRAWSEFSQWNLYSITRFSNGIVEK